MKRFGELLRCQARFVRQPEGDGDPPPVRIELPDGRAFRSDDPECAAVLSSAFGPDVALVSASPAGLRLEFAAGTLGGKHIDTTEMPIAGAAALGTLFDYASMHIVTTSALRSLRAAHPEGNFAVQRLRPNLVVDCAGEEGFVENSWVGRSLAIGSELVVKVSIPAPVA